MSVTIKVFADLGVTGLTGTAGFVTLLASDGTTVVQSRSASVSTISALPVGTGYKGSFTGTDGIDYLVIWDDGAGTPNYTPPVIVNTTPPANTTLIGGVVARQGDGTASAAGAGTITLDSTDVQAASNLNGWQVQILSATTGAGQVATISSATTSLTKPITPSWGVTPTGIVVYALIPPAVASVGATAPAGWINTAAFASGATIPRVTLADTVTTYTGNTPQTGDAFARIGVNGAGLTGITGVTLGANQTTNITGNLTGTVGGLATGAKTDVENAVWNGLHSGHTTTGTFGNFLDGAISGVTTGGVSAATIATAVWQDALSGSDFSSIGSAGKLLKDNIAGPLALAAQIPANFTTATFASAGVFATAALANAPGTTGPVTLADGSITSAKFAAGATIPRVTLADTVTNLTNAPTAGDFTAAQKASLNAATPTVFVAANGLNNVMIESNYNAKQALKVILAACGNIILGNGTTTVTVGNAALPTPTTGVNTIITATMTGVALVNGVPTAVDRTAIPSVVLSPV